MKTGIDGHFLCSSSFSVMTRSERSFDLVLHAAKNRYFLRTTGTIPCAPTSDPAPLEPMSGSLRRPDESKSKREARQKLSEARRILRKNGRRVGPSQFIDKAALERVRVAAAEQARLHMRLASIVPEKPMVVIESHGIRPVECNNDGRATAVSCLKESVETVKSNPLPVVERKNARELEMIETRNRFLAKFEALKQLCRR